MSKLDEVLELRVLKTVTRAEEDGVRHNLTVDFLRSLVVANCPIMPEIILDWEFTNSKADNYPTLIRLNLIYGYIEPNMLFVSKKAKDVRAKFMSLIES